MGRFFPIPPPARLGRASSEELIPTAEQPSAGDSIESPPLMAPNPLAHLTPPMPTPAVRSELGHNYPGQWGLAAWLLLGLSSVFGLMVLMGLALISWPPRPRTTPRYRRFRSAQPTPITAQSSL
ncbi:MAG: hypothetical protein SNJ75_19520 [Gemmataceae bacterium]